MGKQHGCFEVEEKGKFVKWMQKTASDGHQNARDLIHGAAEDEGGAAHELRL